MIHPPSPRLWFAALAAATTHVSAQSTHTAYVVPAGTAGNQAFDGALGLVTVTRKAAREAATAVRQRGRIVSP